MRMAIQITKSYGKNNIFSLRSQGLIGRTSEAMSNSCIVVTTLAVVMPCGGRHALRRSSCPAAVVMPCGGQWSIIPPNDWDSIYIAEH